jgi:hypothetical protein
MAQMALSEKQGPSGKRYLLVAVIILILLTLLAGVILFRPELPVAANTANDSAVSAPASGREATTLNVPAAGSFALADANDRLLVWVAPGQNPGEQTAPGQLVFVDGTGATTPVMEAPAQASTVVPCGDEATSPNGEHFAFFMGGTDGNIYMLTGTDAPVLVDDGVQALGCLGGSTFQWASDSSRFGYIAFEPSAASDEFPDGFLHVFDSASMAEIHSTDHVVAFDVTASTVAYASFFTNDRNEADEAAILSWNGSAEVEVATLQPDEDCFFTSPRSPSPRMASFSR